MKDSDIIRLAREQWALAAIECPTFQALTEEFLAYAEGLLGKERVEEALKKRWEVVDRVMSQGGVRTPYGIPYWITKAPEERLA